MIFDKRLRVKNCPTFIFDNMVNIKEIDPSAIGVNKYQLQIMKLNTMIIMNTINL